MKSYIKHKKSKMTVYILFRNNSEDPGRSDGLEGTGRCWKMPEDLPEDVGRPRKIPEDTGRSRKISEDLTI